ncbi:MAG TPA: YraN family protein [Polyangiaceae bacterium]|nr:YraN family protein [Polyangiaceae bacterium]
MRSGTRQLRRGAAVLNAGEGRGRGAKAVEALGRAPARDDEPGASGDPRRIRAARAERAVAAHLRALGYEIVATNLRLGHLELDVVARRGPLVVVVEVRHRGRGAWTSGFGSIDPAKQRRVRRAGERLWQRRYRDDATAERLRFDAASVSFDGDRALVEYVEAAF